MKTETNMGKVNILGLMDQHILDLGLKTKSMAKEFINGLMVDNTPEIGKTTTWMGMVSTNIKMEGLTKEILKLIENTVKVYILGQTEEHMTVNGKMVNNMEMVK